MTLESLFTNVECFIRLATVKIFRVGVEICKKYCKESISFFPLKQPSCKLLQLNKIFSAFKRPKNNFLLITESAMRKKLKNHFQIFFLLLHVHVDDAKCSKTWPKFYQNLLLSLTEFFFVRSQRPSTSTWAVLVLYWTACYSTLKFIHDIASWDQNCKTNFAVIQLM